LRQLRGQPCLSSRVSPSTVQTGICAIDIHPWRREVTWSLEKDRSILRPGVLPACDRLSLRHFASVTRTTGTYDIIYHKIFIVDSRSHDCDHVSHGHVHGVHVYRMSTPQDWTTPSSHVSMYLLPIAFVSLLKQSHRHGICTSIALVGCEIPYDLLITYRMKHNLMKATPRTVSRTLESDVNTYVRLDDDHDTLVVVCCFATGQPNPSGVIAGGTVM
jgi:hypothetical protein